MNLRLDNERLRRTNKANARAIFKMAEEIRTLRKAVAAELEKLNTATK